MKRVTPTAAQEVIKAFVTRPLRTDYLEQDLIFALASALRTSTNYRPKDDRERDLEYELGWSSAMQFIAGIANHIEAYESKVPVTKVP
jgi:hypothetical protein